MLGYNSEGRGKNALAGKRHARRDYVVQGQQSLALGYTQADNERSCSGKVCPEGPQHRILLREFVRAFIVVWARGKQHSAIVQRQGARPGAKGGHESQQNCIYEAFVNGFLR